MQQTRLFEDYSTTDLSTAINDWVHSARDRGIMHRKLIDNATYETIADEFDMSDRQIGRIVRDLQKVILKHLDTRAG